MATAEQLLAYVQNKFTNVVNCQITYGDLTVEIAAENLLAYCKIFRDDPDFKFDQLMDICGVDYLTYGLSEWVTDSATYDGFSRGVEPLPGVCAGPARFVTVYHLLSIAHNHRIRLRVYAHGEPPSVPSVMSIWQSADWYEREAFDLFGIHFSDHPDLRRILTDYGFVGHPFRKDFPLIGQVEMRYDAEIGSIVYEPVTIKPRTLVPKTIRYVGAGKK